MRTLLFTGKGGVGKTTVAAATALRCADAGLRTMVLSTDPAHSLGDAFDLPLSSVGTPIAAGLWGQQLDALAKFYERDGKHAKALAVWRRVHELDPKDDAANKALGSPAPSTSTASTSTASTSPTASAG